MFKLRPKQRELLDKGREYIENPKNLGKIILFVLVLPIIAAVIASIISSIFIFFSTPLGQCLAVVVVIVLFFVLRKKGMLPF